MDDIEMVLENDQSDAADVAGDAGSKAQEDKPAGNGEEHVDSTEKADGADILDEKSDDKDASKGDQAEKPKFDPDLDEWAKSVGEDAPESDKERALLQKLRDSKREFTKDRQAKKGAEALGKTIETEKEAAAVKKEEPADPIEKRLAAVEAERVSERTSRLQSEFYTANAISDETGAVMADILKEKVAKAPTPEAKLRAIEHWGHPDQLQDLYELAQARELKSSGTGAIADEAAQKERERIAKEQRAGGVSRNAKSTVTKSQDSELDKLWKED